MEAIEIKRVTKRMAFWATVGVIFVEIIFVWFVFYRLAGYNQTTQTIAISANLFLGLIFMAVFGLGWQRIGLGIGRLWEALLAVAATYLVVLILVLVLRALGMNLPALRDHYSLLALAENWILSGLGEELLFAGVLFNVVPFRKANQGRWLAVVAVAIVFAFRHLPGYVAVGLRTGGVDVGIIFKLLLNMTAWCFFGAMYALSGNLWLTAMAHASTDYALLPAIIRVPVIGLVFMILLVVAAWWIGRWRAKIDTQSVGTALTTTEPNRFMSIKSVD